MPRSLRLRLLAGAAAAIFAALAVAWLAMGYLFERHAQRQLESDLIARGIGLAGALHTAPDGSLSIDPQPADPRLNAPASGLYWQVRGAGVLARSRSLWDQTLRAPAPATAGAWTSGAMDGPFDQSLLFVQREVRLEADSTPLVLLLGADRTAIVAARADFARELGLFLGLMWLALSAAAWLQVELGLRPLEDVRAALGTLRKQPSARLTPRDYPPEAAPLAEAINDLADARERDVAHAKQRAADLAHSLRTPLAALAAQARRAREAGAVEAADGLDRTITAATRAIERELARTRAAVQRQGAEVDARAAIARLVQVLEHTERGGEIAFVNEVGAQPLPVSEDTLLELAGPLLENATRFARAQVRIGGGGDVLVIEDDGPGLSEAEAEEAAARGKRLDEHGDGYGLGLAIASELAQASGGALHLGRSPLGGLRVEARWRPRA